MLFLLLLLPPASDHDRGFDVVIGLVFEKVIVDFGLGVVHQLLNIDPLFGRSFEVLNSVFKSHLLGICLANDSLFKVDFISDEDFVNLRLRILVNRAHPVLHVFEGRLVRQVEADYDSLRLSVEVLCDRSEAFLSSCVPYFHVHSVSLAFILVQNEVKTLKLENKTYQ